jgi:hypothetical protein
MKKRQTPTLAIHRETLMTISLDRKGQVLGRGSARTCYFCVPETTLPEILPE